MHKAISMVGANACAALKYTLLVVGFYFICSFLAMWCPTNFAARILKILALSPIKKPFLFYSPSEVLCVFASIGWCSAQNNFLSLSMLTMFTLSAFFFLFLSHCLKDKQQTLSYILPEHLQCGFSSRSSLSS
jgi:hypothetical protein